MSLLDLFYAVDTFCGDFLPHWEQSQFAAGHKQRWRPTTLHPS